MSKFNLYQAFMLLTLALNTGCAMTASSNVKSQAIYAINTVTQANGQTTCVATLHVGGETGTYIDLDGGDQIYCNGAKMNRRSNIANQVWYEVNVAYLPGSTYRIRLDRSNESMSSEIKLPSEIMGAQIEGGITHSIGQPVRITWQKSMVPLESMTGQLSLASPTRSSVSTSFAADGTPEKGSLSFAGEATVLTTSDSSGNNQRVSGPYAGTLTLRRQTRGTLSGAWSGQALGQQEVSFSVTFQ